MLLFVGSSDGEDDKGRRRILSISGTATSGTIICDSNDDIDWSDNDYLTVVNFFPPMPKYSWFQADPTDFRKDGPPSGSGGAGIDYSNQNLNAKPHVVMGRNYAGEIPSGGSLVIQLDASNSQAVADGASISTYAWSITPSAGATFSNSAIANPTLTFTTNGKRQVHCTVTDSNGNTTIGHRAYIIGGALVEFSRSPITEQYDNHVVRCNLTLTSPDATDTTAIRPETDWSQFDDQTMIIITAEDHFGSTQKTISFRDATVYDDFQHILFCGYVISENRDFNADGTGRVELTAVNAVEMFLYSLSLTGVRTPSDWYQMADDLMYVAALLHHLFYWHSTLLEITDWWFDWTDTTKRSAVEEWSEGNIMQRARSLAGPHGRLMAITANSQGEIFVERNLNYLDQSDRNAETTTLTLLETDTQGDRRVRIQQRPSVSQVFVSGGSSTGLLGSFAPFLSISQNVRRAEGTRSLNLENLMLASQTEANNLSGRIQAVENRKILEVELEFSGIYREAFSPTDQQWTNTGTSLASTIIPNIRGTTDLESIRLIPRQVTKNPPVNGFGSTRVVFEAEAPEGLTGRTITLPDIDPNYVAPEIDSCPGLTDVPVPSNILVTGDDTNGVEIYDDSSWSTRNTGLSGDSLKVRDLKVSPFWWLLQNCSDWEKAIFWIATDNSIHRSGDAGKSWDDRTPVAALDSAPAGVTPTTVDYIAIDLPAFPTDIDRNVVAQCREEVAGVWHSWDLISANGGYAWTSRKSAPSGTETRLLDLVIDQNTGTQAYQARQDITNGKVYVSQLTIPSLLVAGAAEDFGAATETEVDNRDVKLSLYVLYDPSTANNEDYVLAYGQVRKA